MGPKFLSSEAKTMLSLCLSFSNNLSWKGLKLDFKRGRCSKISLIAISKLTTRSSVYRGGNDGLSVDFVNSFDSDLMLKSWSSSQAKYIFQQKSRSKRSNESIAFFVVGALGIGTNFKDNPNTSFVARGRDLPGSRSWNVRLEGDEK